MSAESSWANQLVCSYIQSSSEFDRPIQDMNSVQFRTLFCMRLFLAKAFRFNLTQGVEKMVTQVNARNVSISWSLSIELTNVGELIGGLSALGQIGSLHETDISLNFQFSDLKKLTCVQSEWPVSNNQTGSIHSLRFGTGMVYEPNISTSLFDKIDLSNLEIKELSMTLINLNQLSFQVHDIQSKRIIGHWTLSVYLHPVTEHLVPPSMFQPTSKLTITGKLDYFKPNISYIGQVSLQIVNLRQFLNNNPTWSSNFHHPTETRWIDFRQLASSRYRMTDSIEYDFPDQDFCMLRYLRWKNTLVTLSSENVLKCSCSVIWLTSSSYTLALNGTDDEMRRTGVFSNKWLCRNNSASFEQLFDECNFTALVEACNLSSIKPMSQFTAMDLAAYFDWIKAIVIVGYLPIQSAVSVILNVLSALTLKRMARPPRCAKRFDRNVRRFNTMYAFMSWYSWAAAMMSAALMFKPLAECSGGHFCSPLFLSLFVRIYKLLVLDFAVSALFLYTSLAMFWFTSLRWLINSRLIEKYNHTRFRFGPINFVFVVFSVLLASFKLFKGDDYAVLVISDRPFSSLSDSKFFDSQGFEINSRKFDLASMEMAYDFFTVLLFPFLTILIDLFLLRRIKRAQAARAHLNPNSHLTDSENNLHKMIAFNGIFCLIFRLPTIWINLLFHLQRTEQLAQAGSQTDSTELCIDPEYPMRSWCLTAYSLAHTVSQFSFLIQFFIFFRFNSTFRHHLNNLLSFATARK
nr:G protein-coupled receptor [Proales similis]